MWIWGKGWNIWQSFNWCQDEAARFKAVKLNDLENVDFASSFSF